jgi:DNA processing protein
MATPPDRQNFPQRNRIVSALSLGVVLIEAPVKSGAILTMERALRQGKKLFALPGRADIDSFRGNHAWIKEGKAQLIESAVDIANQFESLVTWGLKAPASSDLPSFGEEELSLMKMLPTVEVQIETISQMTKLPASKLNVLLMGLVLKKAVKEFPGKIYKKCVQI